MPKESINVKDTEITLITKGENDYLSITDIAKYKSDEPFEVIRNWLRNRNTLEFLGIWESLYNSNFKPVEFDRFRNQAGLNSFTLSPKKWIEKTDAIGLISKSGRYGGTYAHKDIAFKFANWISVEFELYVAKEFQRLKNNELNSKEWNLQRTLSKINYTIHTDAIKEVLIPKLVTSKQSKFVYANEADLLNVAIFGKTAAEWRDENPNKKGNIRDYGTLEQLVVLSNMESINALLIHQELSQETRIIELNKVAITQLSSLVKNKQLKQLK
ncbi:KilA-N domain-containing protein [Methanobrevibacter filiformis]|uniref:KilA-N domain protein n=1 Tax=Methanobrevibacter filiformis TaxID=55758 RepID=A0A166F1D6_9EURY|nr:KilA-N domain-containing protein [Methanobrevibacter filiformis]KZX17220.1 KilA-N domain protein [Methanobrevibacter filiformis]